MEQLRNYNTVKMMQTIIESKMCLEWICYVYLNSYCLFSTAIVYRPTVDDAFANYESVTRVDLQYL